MKKLFKRFFGPVVAFTIIGSIVLAEVNTQVRIVPNAATVVASSTNTTDGTVLELVNPVGKSKLWMTASGVAATTAGALRVVLVTASGDEGVTNNFENTAYAPIVLAQSNNISTSTNTISYSVDLTGVRYIKIDQIENTFLGVVSNITVRIGMPSGGSVKP